ncbi:ABC transporter ATP-binding protein [Candidatus Venteria ishoeyi]|uniref:ABC transporter ATP-binding protein YtrB n=1 Tax=Candidatus Venteria ishoeyi TaxID=1899563 RepID=A0A1H6F841_9GAMM|nr:ABC transporter ATP-binding protein [Candidatus Venteria ishoeyi]SEH05224.1 ABC transporter ATP-binding protein YtrB [Candidatus Venteria ishoeyi]
MLKIEKLDFGYRKDHKLFNQLDLQLEKGNIYGLLGKNGAGKSTLLKIMTGLLYGQKGKVSLYDNPIDKRLPKTLKEIFFLPEEIFLPDFTISQYIEIHSPFYDKFDKKQMMEILNEFEVNGHERLKNMSYGQKKKFIIAFALATNCSIILMDEPTNGLDIPSKSKFRKVVASLIDENRSILISTHQVRDLENLIDPVIIIENGKIIFNHTIDEISRGLEFHKIGKNDPDPENVLHKEEVFGGNSLVSANTLGEESEIDFELLFNAVLSNTNGIVEQLKPTKP